MIGWMIYRRADAEKNKAYIQWFQEEGKRLEMTIELMIVEEFDWFKDYAQLGSLPDFVLNRSREYKITEHLEAKGVRCVNQSMVSRIANDKWESDQYFRKRGVPTLATWGKSVDKNLKNQRNCGYPLVAKSIDGHGGSEVFRVEDSKDWEQVIEALSGKKIIIQKFCKMPGRDLRIFVLGGKVIAAVLRESDCDFRANYSLGGTVRLVELTESQEDLVGKVCRNFPMEWGGIDLLFDSEDEFYLNEVEDAVGSRSLSELTDLNIANLVLLYIKSSQKKNKEQSKE